MTDSPFRKGREAIRAARGTGGGSFGPKLRFFKWKDGETKTVRFLTDIEDITVVFVHDRIFDPAGKPVTIVCQQEFGRVCEFCNSTNEKIAKRRQLGYGVAVWRQERRDDEGTILGYKDVLEEIEEGEGDKKEKKKVPWVGIVQQASKNFWSKLETPAHRNGTIRDRDFEFTRRGDDKNTEYDPYNIDPIEIPKLVPDMKCPKCKYVAKLHEGFLEDPEDPNTGNFCPACKEKDPPEENRMKGSPGRYAKYTPDLDAFLIRIGSPEYIARRVHGSTGHDGEEGQSSEAEGDGKHDGSEGESLPSDDSEFDRLKKAKDAAKTEQDEAVSGVYG